MKQSTKFKFTEIRIKSLKPELKTRTYSDQSLCNLKLTVTSQGTKTYYVRFKVKNKPINHRLGDASQILVDEARSRAVNYINFTSDLRLEQGTGLTVNDVFNLYQENELSKRATIAGRTHALEVSYNKHLKQRIGKRFVAEVTRKVAKELFVVLEILGYSVHNRCLTAIKSAFNYVIEYEDDINLSINPFLSVTKMTEVQRSRYLTHEEAKRLLSALDKENNQDVADVYRIALFTGARLSNVKTMQWQEINFSNNQWLIPATNTKTNKVYELPLHRFVIDLLIKRRSRASDSPFVFASKTSKYGYVTGGDPIWKSAIKKADLYHENPNIRPRPHDLRRTFATWQLQAGTDISVVCKALCHTSLKHTMVYAHTNLDQVRDSVNKAFSGL